MGEYAIRKSDGAEIKIGTCENMYYLRADQIHLVAAKSGSLDPAQQRHSIRFRFPFPAEDGIEPGEFEPFHGLRVYADHPAEVEHGLVQFRADNGYLCMLPCPESAAYTDDPGIRAYSRRLADNPAVGVALNGYGGALEIVQQRFIGEQLVTICKCKGCGSLYRLETLEDAQPILDGLAQMARDERNRYDHHETGTFSHLADMYDEVARRIVTGYEAAVAS